MKPATNSDSTFPSLSPPPLPRTPSRPHSHNQTTGEGLKTDMVLSSLQKRLETIQNHIHSSPSYRKGVSYQQQHAAPTNSLRKGKSIGSSKQKKVKDPVPAPAPTHVAPDGKFDEVIWTESFLDALPDAIDDDDEGIWPNEWPSVILSSPEL